MRHYDEDGILSVETTDVDKNGSYDVKTFYKNGKLRGNESVKRDDSLPPTRSSFQQIYYENGQIAFKISQPFGSKEASRKVWDEQGRELTSEYDIALAGYKTQVDKDLAFRTFWL